MHLSSLFFLGLSAGALSSPNSNSTSSSLDKRFSYGWVGAFNDPSCTQMDKTETRPELHKGVCTQFAPAVDFVGIDWGSGEHYGFSVLQAYNDEECEHVAATITNSEHKAGDCLSLFNLGNNGAYGGAFVSYGQWSSVKAIS